MDIKFKHLVKRLLGFLIKYYWLIAVINLTIVLYSSTLTNELVWDDLYFLGGWNEIKQPGENWLELLQGQVPSTRSNVYRPLRSFFYAFSYGIWGQYVPGYHLQALGIHLINIVLVYLITRRLFSKPLVYNLSTWLFAIHPVQVEAVTWVTASFDTAGYIFFWLSFYLYLLHRTRRVEVVKRISWHYWLSVGAAMVAFFTYELTLTLPLGILLTDWLILRGAFLKTKNLISDYVPYWLGVMSYFVVRFGYLRIRNPFGYVFDNLVLNIGLSVVTFTNYMKLLVMPIHLSVNHKIFFTINALYPLEHTDLTEVVMPSLYAIEILVSLAVGVVFLVVFMYSIKTSSQMAFGLGWLLMTLLPTVNIIPQKILLAEKYLYLSVWGFSVVFSLLLSQYLWLVMKKYFGSKQAAVLSLGSMVIILIVGYSLITWRRNGDWHTEVSLWESALKISGSTTFIHTNLGMGYDRQQQREQAVEHLEKALELSPDYQFARDQIIKISRE